MDTGRMDTARMDINGVDITQRSDCGQWTGRTSTAKRNRARI